VVADGLVEMELVGVRVELPSNTPIVLLRELAEPGRTLSIFIGGPEATAIAFALEGVETPRPLTHDLMKIVLDELSVSLTGVVITELRDTTYFAELHLLGFGESSVISARPSDAVALAARVGCPIMATQAILEEAGFIEAPVEIDEDGGNDPEEVVEEFKNFIDNVNPEDFAS